MDGIMCNHKKYHNFDKYPEKAVAGFNAWEGWPAIRAEILAASGGKGVIVAECYPGVNQQEVADELAKLGGAMFHAEECAFSKEDYSQCIQPFVTDDRVFGVMNTLRLEDVYLPEKTEAMRRCAEAVDGLAVVYGVGASLVAPNGLLLYFDMPRWEIQCRFRRGMSNWNASNADEDQLRKFKRGYFVEWRMADRLKRKQLPVLDYALDTVKPGQPKMVCGEGLRAGLSQLAREPFRLVPYYAPEVWGGQWMKAVCDLPPEAPNYAWSFDGVPEENSVFLRFGPVRLEFPALNVVFYRPQELLGSRVHARFGDEFPIRFDFLDTMGGQNLSLQVHPLTEYIQHTFGMHYTQDESYYILDCAEGACVYLGLKEDVCPQEMIGALHAAQQDAAGFDADTYVNRFPAKKHDHFLIPAGTVHCSGKDTMVLEISATPYIFTFKLWDWGRVGLDGKPRPVHLNHGEQVIQWDRTTAWTEQNLVNRFELIEEEPEYKVVRTGLHEREFIETYRYELRGSCTVPATGSVCMGNVVEGSGLVITSPGKVFEPFHVHYAETFIVPAGAGSFSLRPLDYSCMALCAFVK